MKKGFVSMATVYAFLIVFLLILSSILSKYVMRNRLINSLNETVKNELMRGITMTKKGFVFIETIIVIVLLSVGIASMYSLMSNITTDIKTRKYFDNISDLYKTNIIRNNTNKNLTGSTYLEITKDNCTSYMSSNCNSLLTDLEVERVVINFTNLDNIINSDTTLPNSLNEYLKTINSYKTNKYIIVNYNYNNKNYYASLEVK